MENFEKTFDNAAVDYDKSRPMYVKEIYDDIFSYKQINQDSHVLEIGMGTGKAAHPILDTHCHFVGTGPDRIKNVVFPVTEYAIALNRVPDYISLYKSGL